MAIDRFLLRRQKGKFHDRLLHWWNALDDTAVPDIPRRMAGSTLGVVHKLLGSQFWSARSLIILSTTSAALTLSALILGASQSTSESLIPDLSDVLWMASLAVENPKEILGLIALNFPFDLLTGVVTLHVLMIVKSRDSIFAFPSIAVDILLAFLLALLCGSAVIELNILTLFPSDFEWPGEILRESGRSIFQALTFSVTEQQPIAMFAITTLVPTVIYMAVLSTMFLAKPVLNIGKKITLLFLERATEQKPQNLIVFSLVGTLFSLIVLIVKTIQYFTTI